MESLQAIKQRSASVLNVGKITKAMEMVSATKMRKAQEVALSSRPYAFEALGILERIARHIKIDIPLGKKGIVNNMLIILIASDKGLTGAFNSQVLKYVDNFINTEMKNGLKIEDISILAIGKKAYKYAVSKNISTAGNYYGIGDVIGPDEVILISESIIEGFKKNKWDRVVAISTHFKTTLVQKVLKREILPVNFNKIKDTIDEIIPEEGRYKDLDKSDFNANQTDVEYIFEPTPDEVVKTLIPYLVKMQIYHLILEANASEHSARMIAMKNASENANELSDSLLIKYNKARQAAITNEIIEITSTQAALN